jgi:hypothetical protein
MNKFILDSALDAVKQQIIEKAAETVATNTWNPDARSIFSPENLEPTIRMLIPTQTPLRNRLLRSRGFGQASAWQKMTSKLSYNAAGGGSNVSGFFADAGSPGETAQTYTTATAAYKLMGRKLEIGGLAVAASQGGPAGRRLPEARERTKMVELMILEEEALLQADSSIETNGYDGLLKQVTTNSGVLTLISASGIQPYFKSLTDGGFNPTLLVINTFQNLAWANNLEKSGSIQRMVVQNNSGQQSNLTVGAAVTKVINSANGSLVDVMSSLYIGDQGLILTETDPGGEAYVDVNELIPMSRVDVPSGNFSQISFIIQANVPRLMGEPGAYKLTGMATQ